MSCEATLFSRYVDGSRWKNASDGIPGAFSVVSNFLVQETAHDASGTMQAGFTAATSLIHVAASAPMSASSQKLDNGKRRQAHNKSPRSAVIQDSMAKAALLQLVLLQAL
eukprot:CAMPEP_0172718150 /NCGR_PEP_ID=MMETSP1074-20121228/73539_1 /TAXON_ID=2916 /ORGANISM="Ceratium fusus, Strain PA161109" /LENGTH=109 /DNA_ID=CAMNT_0013543259 /DNA_START=233 /DNA_END=560 /DNA_ORIENTATION=-